MHLALEVYKKVLDSRIVYLKKMGILQIRCIIDTYKIYIKDNQNVDLQKICNLFASDVSQKCRIFCTKENGKSIQLFNQGKELEEQLSVDKSAWNQDQSFNEDDWVIEKSFLSGVTNPLADVAKQVLQEGLQIKEQSDLAVDTSLLFVGSGRLPDLNLFYNPLIESIGFEYVSNKKIFFINQNTDDAKECKEEHNEGVINLDKIEEANKNRSLNLSAQQIEAVVSHYRQNKRSKITETELETIAQSWSEHCKHNIFSYQIDDIKDGIFKTYIKGATDYIIKNNPDHICSSVFSDNAGAINFDDNHLVCFKVETHNSPSALEPFGGAITGILGVNRDILGFGMSAKPIANYYTFCFDDSEKERRDLFRDKECLIPKLCTKEIMQGVIKGVNVGGNCSGIPTPQGALYFSGAFLAKPLVFVGSAGLIPKTVRGKSAELKDPQDKDLIVIIGGRTGKDGIHGATFSSAAISAKNTKGTEVQIGDPFVQKKLSDALIKEARDLGLFNAITDNGAGGFSSSIGEMGKDGFIVNLENAKLKAKGILPWQIWISESQERMTLAVPPKNLEAFKKIMQKHDVECCVIGSFNKSGRGIVKLKGKEIMSIDLDFLHNKNPKLFLKSKEPGPEVFEDKNQPSFASLKDALKDKNICSRKFIARQYDHEVQGSSVLKPLQGDGMVFADASVIRPVLSSGKGIAQSQDLAIITGNPYQQTADSIEQSVRNIIAVGTNPKKVALLDNFCWSDSYNSKRLWQLKHSAKACYDAAVKLKAPFISGKDSMFNDFKGYTKCGKQEHIRNMPAVLITAVGIVDDIEDVVSLDAKFGGDRLYMLDSANGIKGMPDFYATYHKAIKDRIIASAICINNGGLIVATAKKAIAGQLGFNIKFDQDLIFKKSTGIVVTVAPFNAEKLENTFSKGQVCMHIGAITQSQDFVLNGKTLGNLKEMQEAYNQEI